MKFLIKSKQLSLLSVLVASTALTACGDSKKTPAPEATATPMAAATPAPEMTPTATPEATPTPMVVVTPAPEMTPTPAPEMTPALNYAYQVEVTNLTNAQPMSPIAVGLHYQGNLWMLGQPASMALEELAESGNNSKVLADTMWSTSMSGTGVLMPGATQSIMVETSDAMAMKLSLATMLVNTNDAFTGINAIDLTHLMVGESISLKTRSYDAGTEMNSESSASIPGPAAGGEGYNSARDDVDFVAMHSGVVTVDDGLMTSALTQAHRFDNPTLSISITRTE